MKVDKNIPVPKMGQKYPWNEMKVGDSFFFDGERNTIASASHIRKRAYSENYTIRKVEGGLRVWRTE